MIIIDTIKTNKEKISNGLLRIYFKNIKLDNKTYHKYEDELPETIQEYIRTIKYGSIYENLQNININCNVFTIDKMNEIYISFIGAGGSDKVFETPHIDGIYFFLPYCNVYRCVFAIQGNESIVTEFPTKNMNCILMDDEYCAFDYNNEIHYIYQKEKKSDKQRILIKFHYIVCPKFLPLYIVNFYKTLNIKYNSFMRTVFLNSQNKNSWLAFIVNKGTVYYISFYTCIEFIQTFLFCLVWKNIYCNIEKINK